jgi:hypothetical protein
MDRSRHEHHQCSHSSLLTTGPVARHFINPLAIFEACAAGCLNQGPIAF